MATTKKTPTTPLEWAEKYIKPKNPFCENEKYMIKQIQQEAAVHIQRFIDEAIFKSKEQPVY